MVEADLIRWLVRLGAEVGTSGMSTIDHITSSYHGEVPTAEGLRIRIAVAELEHGNITEALLEGAKSVPSCPRSCRGCHLSYCGSF